MAEIALTHCVDTQYMTDVKCGHQIPNELSYSFDLIDDFYVPYNSIRGFIEHIGLISSPKRTADDYPLASLSNSESDPDLVTSLIEPENCDSDGSELGDNSKKWMQSDYNAENHVLHLIVSRYVAI